MVNIFAIFVHVFLQIMTGTPDPTLDAVNDYIGDLQATREAIQEIGDFDVSEDGGITLERENGGIVEISPDVDRSVMGATFSYVKWLGSENGRALFGPFSPIMIHLSALVTIAFAGALIYIIFKIIDFILSLPRVLLAIVAFIIIIVIAALIFALIAWLNSWI